MTENQLELLRATRLSGQDEHDAAVVAAREAAAQHPEVQAFLDQEAQIDEAMVEVIQRIEPPAGLAGSILAAMKAAREAQSTQLSSLPPRPRTSAVPTSSAAPVKAQFIPLPSSPGLVMPKSTAPTNVQSVNFGNRRKFLTGGISAAAAAGVLGGMYWLFGDRPVKVARIRQEIAKVLEAGVQLAVMTDDKTAITSWFKSKEAPVSVLPHSLNSLPRKGCQIYKLAGHPVSMECLLLPGMREVHIFSIASEHLVDPPKTTAQVITDGDLSIAMWSQGDTSQFLFSHVKEVEVRGLVS